MRKIGTLFISILIAIGLIRYTAYIMSGRTIDRENGIFPKLDLRNRLTAITQQEPIFDFSRFYTDAQRVQYNFESMRNGMEAENGETYTVWKYHSTSTIPEWTTIVIRTPFNEAVGYFEQQTRTKPGYNGSLMEWIDYIGEFIQYIGQMISAVGTLVNHMFIDIIMAMVRILKLIVTLCFVFD